MRSFSLCILSSLVIVITGACNDSAHKETGSIQSKDVYLVSKRDGQIKDSLLVYGIGSLISDSNNLYVAHKGSPHLVVLDADLNYVNAFANHGDGPGESGKVESMVVNDSGVIAFDSKHHVFNYYSKSGQFLRSIRRPMTTPLLTRFTVWDTTIIYSSISDSAVIERTSLNEPYTSTPFLKEMYPMEYKSREEKFANNYRHILPYKGRLMVIGETQPNVEIYNGDGTKKMSFDLRDLDIISDEYDYNLERIKKRPALRAKSLIIVRDAKIYNNSLYLLIIRHVKDMPTANTLVKLNLSENNISFDSKYNLLPSDKIKNPKNFPWYYAFVMVKDKTILYESALDEFHTYDLK